MQNRRNFYRILQVQPDAPLEVIKNNYRTLLQKLRLHPDLGGDHWNASHINQAWRTLRDPGQRAAYDQQLLREYDIQTLSQGRLAAESSIHHRTQPLTGSTSGNRRNYYRILNIQTDAPAAIITASYQIQMKNPRAPIDLIQEAFAVLSDPQQRLAYDRVLSGATPSGVLGLEPGPTAPPQADSGQASQSPGPAPPPGSTSIPYQPLITQFCYFCKTPHAHSPMGDQTELCSDCDSPLFAAPAVSDHNHRRALSRISTQAELVFYLDWPGLAYCATLMDLSPDGLRFTTSEFLHKEQVIKVEGEHFKCVSRIMHRKRGTGHESVGSRFITVLFNRQRGNFVSAHA